MSHVANITTDSVIKAAPQQVSCELDEEAVILSLEGGVYYGLNPVAARIWELVQQPQSVADICATLIDEYDVDPDRCLADVRVLLIQLREWALIQTVDRDAVD